MRFAFRVDSSPNIGMGHLMRCLTLAGGLKARGNECYFICRDFVGNGSVRVQENDFNLETLGTAGVDLDDSWLGVSYSYDVKETINVISQNPIDWLIIDHYEIDNRWEEEFRSQFPDVKIMVIDDLVDRNHDCDLFLDQTYGRLVDEYKELVSPNAQFCLGTEFALLRPQFKELREQILQTEKAKNEKCHILVTLGGGDNYKPIQIIGKALKELAAEHSFSATVLTANTPKDLLADYLSLGSEIELITFSGDIENEMAKADFVIGAGGGTSWERCCLGLPTVVLTIADNQIEIAKILNEKNAGISVKTDVEDIKLAVVKLSNDPSLRQKMSRNAANLCDGDGVSRVIGEILSSSFEFRKATIADAQFIYDARYSGDAAKFYRNKEVPSLEAHIAWLEKALDTDKVFLFCIGLNGEDIAHVRLDKIENQNNYGEISICLSREARGKGLGQAVLSSANTYFADLGFSKIHAEVQEANIASASIFKQAGYLYLSTDNNGFMRYLWRA